MSKMRKKINWAFSLIMVFGCGSVQASMPHVCRLWINSFYKKSLKDRISMFNSYDLNSRYNIYVCGNQFVHPPAIYLASTFASKGADIVSFLKEKLLQSDDDLTVRDIILVFAEMTRLNTYAVSKDFSLMNLINKKLNGMRDAGWKEIVQRNVSEIDGSRDIR
jgi:hypothetical protein